MSPTVVSAGPHGFVEVAREGLDSRRAEELLRFWRDAGALAGAEASARLAQVVCVLRGPGGGIAGVSSVFAADIPVVGGRRFWVYSSFLAPGGRGGADALLKATFAALDAEFQASGGPIGLCVLVDDPEELRRRPDAEWRDPRLLYAGWLADGRQVRIAYFAEARINA